MSEIKQLDTKIVYQNRWMTVREDRVKRPSGAEGIYGVVEKPDFVVIIPYEKGMVFLVEQYRYAVQKRFWEFPQGSWELKPDTAPEQLATAELKEETGLTADKMHYVGYQYQGYGYANQGYHIFLATGLTQGKKELDAEEEGLISEKFKIREFEQMIIDGKILDATTTCAYALAKMKELI